MKTSIFCFLVIFILSSYFVNGMTYIIGNDTINYNNGYYYKISLADTFYIDTSIIFVRYESYASAFDKADIEHEYELVLENEFCFPWNSYLYNENQNFITLSTALNNEPLVNMIEFNTIAKYLCEPLEPNDNSLNSQWYLERIQALYAWAITTGDEDIIVAILDSGFDWEHLDLGPGNDNYQNIFLNKNEDDWEYWDDPTSGNEHDDDGNDCEDDWKGWGETGNDVRNYDLEWLYEQFPGDPEGAEKIWRHGTYIAGIIGAKSNNDHEGIAGIAGGWNNKGASLLFFKLGFTDHPPGNFVERIADGICYATDPLNQPDQARIIEMAFTVDNGHDLISAALDYAYENGAFLVAASGNNGGSIRFPANYQHVFSVGATDLEDYKCDFSNWYDPVDGLDLSAPGIDIFGLQPDDGYVSLDGTSPASAMVAGTAALMLSINPDLSSDEITDILHLSGDKVHDDYYDYTDGWCEELGYGRLNTYQAVCLAWGSADDLEITSDQDWDNNLSFMQSVYVKNGVTLTITAEIQFGPEAKLIIEPGGIIILDKGTLTNLKCCGHEFESWPGIEVWGNRNASQHTPGSQGTLMLMNDAVIENAVVAVELWKPNEHNMTGGIIEAENSTFRNNACAIHAIYYRNYNPANPNVEVDYIGTFSNCSFIIDLNYLGDKTFYKHVDLDRVRGIKFYGCSFERLHYAENVSQWNLGIAAYNAGFHVLPGCTSQIIPCPQIDSCRFNGFNWAIGAYNNSTNPILIVNAHFDDNVTGVYLSNANYAVILENFFESGYNAPFVGSCGFAYGLGADIINSNGFAVENNHFRKNSLATTGNYAGIRVQNCPSTHDIIYKNDLVGPSFANYAEGINREFPDDDAKGVEYRCNYNDFNGIDFIVKNYDPTHPGMIRGSHGNREPDTACGNYFSPDATWHIRNEGTQTINWFYNENNTLEWPEYIYEIDPIYVNEVPVADQNECPDHYGGGIHLELTQEERQLKEIEFAENLADYNSVQALYESLIDGGDTESELSEIESAEPDDMWELRSQLLGHSPHLSQEVLRAMADRTDVFPDDVLLDILSANPDELDKDTLLYYLEQKEDPLPDYMLEILRQVANGITYKTILQEDMAYYHSAKTHAAQDIIRSIMNDSAFLAADYRSWLDNLGGLQADKQIIASYLYEKDTTSAMGLLDLIPDLYNLEGQELDEFNDYKSLIEMQIAWNTEGKSLLQLDSLDLEALDYNAVNGASAAGNMSRNILEYANYQYYCNCIQSTDTNLYKSERKHPGITPTKQYGLIVNVEPNPAKSWIAFNYQLPDENSEGIISISDISGKLISKITISGKAGQKVINTNFLDPGLYYYMISVSGLSKSGKFIIQ